MIYLLCKEKWQGEGRMTGTDADAIDMSVVLLSTDGTLPQSYQDVQNLTRCDFAPGSILIDTLNNQNYIYDGEEFKIWG